MPISRENHPLVQQLCCYGARPEDVALLDAGTDEKRQVRYLDLIRNASGRDQLWPAAVVEADGQSVLYVVSTTTGVPSPQAASLARLRKVLWFRAGAAHVALVEPGKLTLYPVAPSKGAPAPRQILANSPGASALVPTLAYPPATRKSIESTAVAVHELLLGLLTNTTDAMIKIGLDPMDALSLVGRALFVRFLVDRGVLSAQEVEDICGAPTERCFQNSLRAAKMSAWLDDTFNGDFLPLPSRGALSWYRKLDERAFHELSKILLRAEPSGQTRFTWGDGWNDLLFDHIPVGLLSQVYELHAHRYDAEQAQKTSVYYTPRYIAEYMVDEVFSSLGEEGAYKARVLDPAVGGGVFLVAAFRRLAAERWKIDQKPPNSRVLRTILYRQLRGFDISEPALRLCSLGLYLTAIELDPNPRPTSRLKFDTPLLGNVLYHVADRSPKSAYLGSLSPDAVGSEHREKYDVVVGNPPWTSWKTTDTISKDDLNAQVAQVEGSVRNVVRARLGDVVAAKYRMTDKNPDVPFFWRAMEWAKKDGFIALAINARLLFKQSTQGRRSRKDLFDAVRITGILNGTALRDTKFWPSVKSAPSGFKPAKIRAPFCLIFARNSPPPEWSSFYFVSPEMEKSLNDGGRLRIDPTNARPVELSELRKHPTLLKLRFRGTPLDADVMARVDALQLPTLGEYWKQKNFASGEGFQVVAGGNPVSEKMANTHALTKEDVAEMPYLVDVRRLSLLGPRRLHRARDPNIYEAPLVIVDATPPVERDASRSGALLAFDNVVYNESFFGFSCAKTPEPELWARYLFLILNSRLVVYFALLTSGKFGVERDVFLLDDLKRLPFVALDKLPPSLMAEIPVLSERLINDPVGSFEAVERWAAAVYRLSPSDVEIVRDTLDVAPPFANTRTRAQERPNALDVRAFGDRLCSVIQPFLTKRGRHITAQVLSDGAEQPWVVFQVDTYSAAIKSPIRYSGFDLREILEQAETMAASEAIMVAGPSTLLVALVAQYRYCTRSRARLIALELVHEHAKILLGGG